ncbi:MAG: carboxylesterase/lipase family protein [Chitinophagia bacterium]|nr:carboxylesterase/lipase family protein [Chitinophagia bacterium]
MRRVFLLLLGLNLLILSTIAQTPIAETQFGKVSGMLTPDEKIKVFKGIPFASPPVGDLRWKRPMPPTPWKDVKVCTTFSASPMQPKPAPFFVWSEEYLIPTEPISEDCLYLNVWTSNQENKKKKPVLVWIYGGGFSSGGSACPIYDGEAFAREDIVFVSINYRVGIFGFYAHHEIDKNNDGLGSGNFGILDQIEALKWVKKNIANFGGDPENVTIAGQSAGSMSVNCLVATPLAKGLFNKAIAESGANFTRGNTSKDQAVEASDKYALLFGKSTLEEMRKIPAEELLKKTSGIRGIYVDGIVLPEHVLDIFLNKNENKVTLLTGWNQDEGISMGKPKDAASFTNEMKVQYKANAEKLLNFYPGRSDQEAAASQKNLARDMTFGMQNFAWSNIAVENGSKVFVYRFKKLVPEDKEGSKYSAFHTGEVPYAYNNLKFVNRPFTNADHALAKTMSQYWINFIIPRKVRIS